MPMLKFSGIFAVATALSASIAYADSWQSQPNMGAQGIQGALTKSDQDGMFDLSFDCSAREGENRTVLMTLLTLPDSPLAPGNETSFPIWLTYSFKDGSIEKSEILVDWVASQSEINVWTASFPMDKAFLRNFAHSQTLDLITFTNELVFQYDMGGSARAARALVEYCYSGDYQ